MTKDEVLALALEALENGKRVRNAEGGTKYQPDLEDKAITAIKQARALDKMAENARDLGLDYEPCCKDQTCPKCKPAPVQEPVAQCTVDVSGVAGPSCEPLNWHKAPAQPAPVQAVDIAALVEGMEVSIDVSTGDHDSGNRLFGSVTMAQENQGSKHGLILLVQDPEANFKTTTPPAQPAVPDAMTSADIQEHIEYVAGWNDCRQAMMEMMK
jgi:hypothetical protein